MRSIVALGIVLAATTADAALLVEFVYRPSAIHSLPKEYFARVRLHNPGPPANVEFSAELGRVITDTSGYSQEFLIAPQVVSEVDAFLKRTDGDLYVELGIWLENGLIPARIDTQSSSGVACSDPEPPPGSCSIQSFAYVPGEFSDYRLTAITQIALPGTNTLRFYGDPIPEPSAGLLAISAITLLAGMSRRK